MRKLLLASMFLLLAPAMRGEGAAPEASQPSDDSFLAAYNALKPEEIEAKKIDALPELSDSRRIEVKQRMKSASFGHKTFLVVPLEGGQAKRTFFVQFGKSTNRPAQLFGPFSF